MLGWHGKGVERDLLLLGHRLVVVLTLRGGVLRVADGGTMAPKLWQGGRTLEALEVKRGQDLLLLWEATCLRFLP